MNFKDSLVDERAFLFAMEESDRGLPKSSPGRVDRMRKFVRLYEMAKRANAKENASA